MGPMPTTFGAEAANIDAAARRSALLGIDPSVSEIPHAGEPHDAAQVVRRLSRPVLDELIARVADAALGVVLADRRGGLTWRGAANRDTLAAMDARNLDVGCSLAEGDVGTNGVGTSLETRLPTIVVGDDHHLDCFKGFTCANAPIIHPITRRLEGTVGILCPVEDTGPLLLPTALQLSTEIGRLLLEHATPEERFLLEQFLLQRGRSKRATATIGEGVLIATPAAQDQLVGVDHAELWERVQAAVRNGGGGATDLDLEQPAAPTLRLRCRPLFRDGDFGGATVDLVAGRSNVSRRRQRDDRLGDLVGRSDVWRAMVRDARRAARLDVPVLVEGERGSGRLSVARALAELDGATPVTVFDSGTILIDGARDWVVGVDRAMRADGVVVLRRVGELPDNVAAALASVLASGRTSARVVATTELTSADTPGLAALFDQLDVARITVPPLRERRDDIEPLVRQLSARFGLRAIEPKVVSLLYRQAWPGNVTELGQTLRSAHASSTTEAIGVRDLPRRASTAPANRPLHGLHQQEADAIMAALRATATRREAAEMLGISRATLYRRIEAYGLAGGEF